MPPPVADDSDRISLTMTEKATSIEKLETVDIALDTRNHDGETTPISSNEKVKKEKPPLDSNVYSTKKTVANGMMDLALLTANASQLKMLLNYNQTRGQLFAAHVTCLSLSIIFQVAVGVLLIMNSRYNINRASHQNRAEFMNNATVVGVFLITVVNVLASSFDDGP